jgi:hypothetical protein
MRKIAPELYKKSEDVDEVDLPGEERRKFDPIIIEMAVIGAFVLLAKSKLQGLSLNGVNTLRGLVNAVQQVVKVPYVSIPEIPNPIPTRVVLEGLKRVTDMPIVLLENPTIDNAIEVLKEKIGDADVVSVAVAPLGDVLKHLTTLQKLPALEALGQSLSDIDPPLMIIPQENQLKQLAIELKEMTKYLRGDISKAILETIDELPELLNGMNLDLDVGDEVQKVTMAAETAVLKTLKLEPWKVVDIDEKVVETVQKELNFAKAKRLVVLKAIWGVISILSK